MKPRSLRAVSGSRRVAAEVVARVLDDGAFTQPALASALDASALDTRDKALCTELVYGTLRWARPLEQSLLRGADRPGRGLDARIRPHLLVAAYQLQHLSDRIPAHAAVSEAVDAVRAVRPGLEGFANALLRRLGSPLHASLAKDAPVAALAKALDLPPALADAVTEGLDANEAREALLSLNGRPTAWAVALGDVPVLARRHRFVPGAFTLEGGPVTDDPGFAAGQHLVMDPGSATCALLVDAQPGWRVLDLCAAPGGKSALLARAVGERGQVLAVERSAKRAARIGENARRLHLEGRVTVLVKDVLELRAEDLRGPVDAILLDAPCSGLGTTRRKPEIKLRRSDDDVKNNAVLQGQLLGHALSLLRPGGVLVYSVCSPLPAEGREVVARVLGATPDVTRAPARQALPWLPEDAVDAQGAVRLLPHRHDCDAFWAARLVRGATKG